MKSNVSRRLLIAFQLAALLGACFAGSVSAESETTVNISPYSQNVNPGQTFTVGVYVNPGEPIVGVSLTLSFNAALLQANSVTEGNLLSQGCSTLFLPGTINNTTGTITGVAGATKSSCTVSNPGTFVNISFTARNVAGMSLLNMYPVAVSDMNASPVSVGVSNGSVAVVTPGVTVTPALTPTPAPTPAATPTATTMTSSTPSFTPLSSETPAPTATATPSSTATPAATPTAAPDSQNGNGTPAPTSSWVWAVAGFISAFVIAGAAIIYYRARKRAARERQK